MVSIVRLGAAPVSPSIPAGWREIDRVQVTADAAADAGEGVSRSAAAVYPRGSAAGRALYTPPIGTTVLFIQAQADPKGPVRQIFVEPAGSVTRNWEVLGEPLDVKVSGAQKIKGGTFVREGDRRSAKISRWWLLPLALGMIALALKPAGPA